MLSVLMFSPPVFVLNKVLILRGFPETEAFFRVFLDDSNQKFLQV